MGDRRDGLIEIGEIVRAHGIRGEVKAVSHTGRTDRFTFLDSVYIEGPSHSGEWKKILHVQSGLKHAILRLEGVSTRNQAEALRGCVIRMRREDLPGLSGGVYYVSDIVGFEVTAAGRGRVGVLKDVLAMPAQDVLVIATEGGEIMVPAVEAYVKAVDVSNKEIRIEPIDGLLDLDAD